MSAQRATVIGYHAVGECDAGRDPHRLVLPTKLFEAQMAFLAKRRTVVPLSAVVDGSMRTEKPAVAITFDDGYRGVLENAAPILARYGFPAVCFVPTAWIGEHNQWDPFGPNDCRLDVMNADDLHRAEDAGIQIESHAHTHRDLAALDATELGEELDAAVDRFRDVMGRAPRYLAYPYGEDCPRALQDAVRRAGFEAAFTIRFRALGPYARERVVIRRQDGMSMFALKTTGRYLSIRHSWIARTAASAVRPLSERKRVEATV